ncbi:MAG TPA: methyl-accepting chemotaxis protein [Oscillospiraceae bacterium]|nr:methyl-accepting chemotaxis protein [Oscillospiraceae bacterium]
MKIMAIKTKMSVSVLVVSILCSLMIGFFMYISYKNSLTEYTGEKALGIASTVSVNIDGDLVKKYDKTGEKDENYDGFRDYLSKVKEETGLTYIYIMTDAGENYKYIAEGIFGEETASKLNDTDSKDTYGSEPAAALSEGKPVYSEIYSNGEWGDLISAFAPIYDSNGQIAGVLGLDISADSVKKSMMNYLPILLGGMLLSCAVYFVLINILVNKMIVRPIKELESTAINLSEGNFNVNLSSEYLDKNDEIGNLSRAYHKMSSNMKSITDDISYVLSEMAAFNLAAASGVEYYGDFRPIEESIIKISDELNAALSSITKATEQVKIGSGQVSGGAQVLSSGAAEQAAAIEELSATISEVHKQANDNSENVSLAKAYVGEAESGVLESNEQMNRMLSAMSDIEHSSNEISKIIKVIDDIAFQTNILALNAAVEAARAGAAGKGFAVVAEEVRNLASKSAEAAKQTTALIENSINLVRTGSEIAEKTAAALAEVGEKTNLVSGTMEEIAQSSTAQASSIEQINIGVGQISDVVQANSATAEESAAISEELSGQANMLRAEIGKFRLR